PCLRGGGQGEAQPRMPRPEPAPAPLRASGGGAVSRAAARHRAASRGGARCDRREDRSRTGLCACEGEIGLAAGLLIYEFRTVCEAILLLAGATFAFLAGTRSRRTG